MSPNETEKDISLTWKDKQGEQQLCECVCVCEREREREKERERGRERERERETDRQMEQVVGMIEQTA